VHVLEERDRILQAECDAFENGAHPRVLEYGSQEPDQGSSRFGSRCGVRSDHEIRSPQQAIGTGGVLLPPA